MKGKIINTKILGTLTDGDPACFASRNSVSALNTIQIGLCRYAPTRTLRADAKRLTSLPAVMSIEHRMEPPQANARQGFAAYAVDFDNENGERGVADGLSVRSPEDLGVYERNNYEYGEACWQLGQTAAGLIACAVTVRVVSALENCWISNPGNDKVSLSKK